MVATLFLVSCDIAVLANNVTQLAEVVSQNGLSVSENDTDAEKVADFDAEDIELNAQSGPPYRDYELKANIYPEGSPSISFECYPTQGKKASELLPGEWMFDQEFARGLLFDQFNVARNTPSNWRLKNNDGSWYSVEPITNTYVWDENLEAVAMQRAIEQVGTDGHIRPNGASASEAYMHYSVTGMEGIGNAYNRNATPSSALNPYWCAQNFNELTYVFNPTMQSREYPNKDYSTDASLAYLIVNDPDIGYMEENRGAGGQGHRRIILEDRFYRIGIGCVRTSDGHIITAVEVCEDMTPDSPNKIPVTMSHTAEWMENMFSTTYLTYTMFEGRPMSLYTVGDKARENLTYKEGTAIGERSTLDLKAYSLADPSQVAFAEWRKTIGVNESGNYAYLLDSAWVSSDTSVAIVDDNGIITPIGPGTASFTCEDDVFCAFVTVDVVESPLPSFEFVPVIAGQTIDVSSGNSLTIPYTLVCRSYGSEETYGQALNIPERGVSITCSNPDIKVTNTVAADGMSGKVTLTYTGDTSKVDASGLTSGQLVFSSTDKHLLRSYGCVISVVGTKTVSGTGSGNTGNDKPSAGQTTEVKEGKQTISVSSTFKKATSKSKAYTIKKSKVKKTKTYNLKVKVKTEGIGHGKVTYKVTYPKGTTSKQKKLFKVSSRGKITVKKGVKKGTYKITISAARVKGVFKKATKTIYVKVK